MAVAVGMVALGVTPGSQASASVGLCPQHLLASFADPPSAHHHTLQEAWDGRLLRCCSSLHAVCHSLAVVPHAMWQGKALSHCHWYTHARALPLREMLAACWGTCMSFPHLPFTPPQWHGSFPRNGLSLSRAAGASE